ncbi:restriction endonuclease subunit S [Chryseobacterium sp. 5_R23647]|uniref:restriction endonuclease subunit S n=1 Tax=Chryseobacterium sp. 5_R23647 TaxID=2258964 RepID=UPI000E229496|nr:restriction endonuclease subunit S [Chryseobacterium sp. 5_R23647]REC39812.1 restriction endonuclease subunit S [Chryseobacterium sp. 5_R23647]
MNKNSEQLIPDLRFPEFVNGAGWNIKELRKIGKTISGLTGKSGDDFGSGKPYVTYKQVFGNSSVNFSECLLVNIGDDENQNVIQKGDVLFTTSSETPDEVAFASVVIEEPKEPTYLNSFCFIYRPEDLNNIDPEFSRYLFRSKIFRELVGVLGQGSTRFNISKSAFLDIILPFPNPKEQHKIANCLSSLDELITAQKEKLELLKNHKKGLMQNLFPQEGETVPKFRFPEFENDGEWEEKPLKSIFSIFQGFAFSSNDSVSYGTRWLKIADVGIQQMKEENPTFLPINFKNEYKKFLVKRGDYVLALTRPILNMELKIAKVDDIFDNALLNQRVGKIVTPNNIDFVYYLLHTKNMVVNINKNIAGNEPPNLSFQQIERILNRIPYNIEEQQKIAFCLSSLDKLISSQTAKIEKLQFHKKGLMQGLFPKIID